MKGKSYACGCFHGLFAAKRVVPVPDSSPQRRFQRAVSFEEALLLVSERHAVETELTIEDVGHSPVPTKPWATPVPRRGRHSDDPHSAGPMDSKARKLLSGVKARRSQFEAEQLLASPGGLPRPMAAEERERAIRFHATSPTTTMLSQFSPALLSQQTEAGQDLRRRCAAGSTVVFVSAGLQGKRFIYERAAELGVKSVIIDHYDSWAKTLADEGVIWKFVSVDMSKTTEAVYEEVLRRIQDLNEDVEGDTVDAITTYIELSVPLVARLCEAMGLPGLRPDAVDAARDKHRTRASLKAAGLATPRNMLVRNEGEVPAAAHYVGFPAVLKPVSGAASLGVKKVESEQDLLESYREVTSELRSLVVSCGALIKGNGNDGVAAANVADLTVLLEQYLDGPEVDVDIVMSDGQWRYAAVSDNGPTLEPYFNETWAVCPSLLPKDQQRQLKDFAVASLDALGFTAGIFHVECKYSSTGPQLIEVNARMGGGQVRECNLITWGVDLVEEQIFLALGIPARPPVPREPAECAAYCYVNAKQSGKVVSNDSIRTLADRNGVVWAKPLVRPGDVVVGPADGLPTWLCDMLVTGDSPQLALDYLLGLEAEVSVNIE